MIYFICFVLHISYGTLPFLYSFKVENDKLCLSTISHEWSLMIGQKKGERFTQHFIDSLARR